MTSDEEATGVGMIVLAVPGAAFDASLIEMASHLADLTLARRACELALERRATEEGKMFADLAVISFGRCLTQSRRRGLLTDYVAVPDGHAEVLLWLKDHRHQSVAHSGSDTTQTRLMAGSADGKVLRGVFIATMSADVPEKFLVDAIALIDDLSGQLEDLVGKAQRKLDSELTWEDIVAGQTDEPAMVIMDSPEKWSFGSLRASKGGPLRLNTEWERETDVDEGSAGRLSAW